MPTSVWNGTISLGMINISVKMYKATDRATSISFNNINSKTNNKVIQPKIDSVTGEPVEQTDIVKGYKVGDEYIIVDPEEIQKLHPKSSSSLELVARVPLDCIDEKMYEEPYILGTDDANARAYHLLRETLDISGQVAVGKIVIRQTERLCAIIPGEDDNLELHVLRWDSQIRELDSIAPDPVEMTSQERQVMKELFNTIPEKDSVSEFKNEYNDQLVELIEAQTDTAPATETKVHRVAPSSGGEFLELLNNAVKEAKGQKKVSEQ